MTSKAVIYFAGYAGRMDHLMNLYVYLVNAKGLWYNMNNEKQIKKNLNF